jgi:hypothetical protein
MEQTTILGLFQLLQMPAALYSSSLDVSAITEKLLLTNCCIIFFMLLLGVTPTIWDGIGVNEMKFFPFVFGWKTGADFFVKIESLYHFLQDPAFKKANENVDWHIRWGNLFNLWQQQNPSVSFTNVLGLPAFSARQNLAHELIQQFCKALVVKINTELPGQVQSQTDIQLLIDAIAQSAAQSHASCFVFKL